MTMAASFIGLLFVARFLFSPASFSDPQQIYALYEAKQFIPLTSKSEVMTVLNEAVESFKAKKYSEAVNAFNSYLDNTPNDLQILFYKAIVQRNIAGQEEEALVIFDQLINNPTFRQSAEWEKALTLLKLEDLEACRELLESILKVENHTYKKDAKQLLKYLDRLAVA